MCKTIITTPKAPAVIGPYSQGVNTGSFVFLSGQIPIEPVSGKIPEGIEAQTKQVLNNIKAILFEASLNLKNVVKTTVFLKNLADFPVVNNIYAEYFKAPFPARSTVEVSALPKDALIEIECIALK